MQLVRYRRNQDMLMETPASVPELFQRDAERARAPVRRALGRRPGLAERAGSEAESGRVRHPVVPAEAAATPEEAVQVAASIGFPVSIRTSGYTGTGELSAVSAGIALNRDSPEGSMAARRTIARAPGTAPRRAVSGLYRARARSGGSLSRAPPRHRRGRKFRPGGAVRPGRRYRPDGAGSEPSACRRSTSILPGT